MLFNLKLVIFTSFQSVLAAPLAVSTSPELAQVLAPAPQVPSSSNNDASFQNTGLTFGDSFNSGSGNQFSPINSIGGISGTGISKALNFKRRALPKVHGKLI